MKEAGPRQIPSQEQIREAGRILRQIPRKEFEVRCEICETFFMATRSDAQFCSPRCRKRAQRQR